ncbi:carotenoid oxygenase [Sphingomonas koreensis]|nr:carotenoid oxygenase [Sphingomonas koreensis]
MASSIETAIRGVVTKGVSAIADFNRKRLPRDGAHPFLTGIHQPMTRELTIDELAVTGTIPAALDGRYLRIGPNPVAPDPAGYHWFVGDGMVHAIKLEGGEARWYRNRWIRSHAVAEALGERAAPGPRHSFDTVNTNVVGIAGRTFALVEAGSYPVELSDTLDEQTYNPFNDTLVGSFTAHPHQDPLTGEWHAIAYEATDPDTVRHVVLSPGGQVTREEPIAVRHGPSIHDCAFTQRFAVVMDLPVTFSMKAMIGGHSFPYRWNPDHAARVGLLPRSGAGGEIIWCALPAPAYAFHVANAFDLTDGRVALDVVAYDSMFQPDNVGPDAVPRGLERWTIDPSTQTVATATLDVSPQEFPRIDDRRWGQPYRYAYSLGLVDTEFAIGAHHIIKHDLEDDTHFHHDFGPDAYPGEFVFVPRQVDAGEDDGWLIGLVIDMAQQTTDLVILDAQRFEDAPVASIRVPHRVPPGFHGNWLPSA